jgi:hypothetical protein
MQVVLNGHINIYLTVSKVITYGCWTGEECNGHRTVLGTLGYVDSLSADPHLKEKS